MKKVILAHVSKQHSFQTAIALKRQGLLYKYITTVYDGPASLTTRLKSFLKGNALKKAGTRSCPELGETDVLQFYELLGLLRIFIGRFKFLKFLQFDLLVMNLFSKKVAQYAIKENVDAIIVYDGLTSKYLDLIKKKAPGIKIIMEVTIMARPYMKQIFEKDMERWNHDCFKEEERFLWQGKYLDIVQRDFNNTDYFFAPSEAVINSLLYCGVPAEKIIKIPYGVAIEQFTYSQKRNSNVPFRLLFVGNLSYRKGIHHLLDVVSANFSGNEIILDLAGGYDPEGEFYKMYSRFDNINFLGFVTRDVITKRFQESDVFVMPTLAEGLALVILEALATGTPVICTEYAGGNDAITDYENGIVCKAGDRDSFLAAVKWMMQKRERLPDMSEAARASSMKYTWEKYYESIAVSMSAILNRSKSA